MDTNRRTALLVGIYFIITFVASIPAALILYKPILDDVNYIVGTGTDTHVFLGAFLEIITVVANIATAVVLFRSSSGTARAWRWAMSRLASWNPP